MLLKHRLLTRFEPLIFTVLSDDDTILLIATTAATAEKFTQVYQIDGVIKESLGTLMEGN
jgi:arginine repressor